MLRDAPRRDVLQVLDALLALRLEAGARLVGQLGERARLLVELSVGGALGVCRLALRGVELLAQLPRRLLERLLALRRLPPLPLRVLELLGHERQPVRQLVVLQLERAVRLLRVARLAHLLVVLHRRRAQLLRQRAPLRLHLVRQPPLGLAPLLLRLPHVHLRALRLGVGLQLAVASERRKLALLQHLVVRLTQQLPREQNTN